MNITEDNSIDIMDNSSTSYLNVSSTLSPEEMTALIAELYKPRYVDIVTNMILFIIGALPNLHVLKLLIKARLWNSSRHHFLLLNLAVADCIVMFIMIPGEVLKLSFVSWRADIVTCKIFQFLRVFGLYESSFILVCISFDRYQAVINPFDYQSNEKSIKIMVLCSWILSFILSLPQTFVYAIGRHRIVKSFYVCTAWMSDPELHRAYNISSLVMMYILPLIVMALCYLRICFKTMDRPTFLSAASLVRKYSSAEERSSSKRKGRGKSVDEEEVLKGDVEGGVSRDNSLDSVREIRARKEDNQFVVADQGFVTVHGRQKGEEEKDEEAEDVMETNFTERRMKREREGMKLDEDAEKVGGGDGTCREEADQHQLMFNAITFSNEDDQHVQDQTGANWFSDEESSSIIAYNSIPECSRTFSSSPPFDNSRMERQMKGCKEQKEGSEENTQTCPTSKRIHFVMDSEFPGNPLLENKSITFQRDGNRSLSEDWTAAINRMGGSSEGRNVDRKWNGREHEIEEIEMEQTVKRVESQNVSDDNSFRKGSKELFTRCEQASPSHVLVDPVAHCSRVPTPSSVVCTGHLHHHRNQLLSTSPILGRNLQANSFSNVDRDTNSPNGTDVTQLNMSPTSERSVQHVHINSVTSDVNHVIGNSASTSNHPISLNLITSLQERQERNKNRILKHTFIIVITYMLCWAPYAFMSLWHQIDEESAYDFPDVIAHLFFSLVVANSAINPYIYGRFLRDQANSRQQ